MHPVFIGKRNPVPYMFIIYLYSKGFGGHLVMYSVEPNQDTWVCGITFTLKASSMGTWDLIWFLRPLTN